MSAGKEGGAWILREVSPPFLFFFGLALAPAFWLQGRLAGKAALALLFFALAAWSRPRGWWRGGLASLVFLAVTTLLNLAVPLGRVLWRLGGWSITEGALQSGLAKGLTLVGLACLSRFCVRAELRLPGAAGRYVARSLFYLNRLLEARRSLSLARLGDTLDRVLLELYSQSPAPPGPKAEGPGGRLARAAAFAVLGALAILSYGLLLV
jgi:hypothetical protein